MSASASASAPAAPGRTARPAADGHRTSQSLRCGLALIKQFTPERPERGTTELARELGVSPATASRFASTCLELGFLERGKRGYRLTRRSAGPGLAVLATLAVTRAGESVLRQLHEQTGRTVSLVILDGAEVLYVKRRRGFQRGEYQLQRGLGAGSRRPAKDTPAGRALLGEIEARPPEIEARPPEQPPEIQVASGLIVDEGALPGRARGLAIVVEVEGERTSAIELTAPAESISATELVAEFGEPLRAASGALRAALGADSSEERVAAQTT